MTSSRIVVYGTEWCGDCRRARRILKEAGIEFDFINIDRDPQAEALVRQTNRGMRSVPTIFFPDGDLLVEPSNERLRAKLKATLPA